MSKTLTFFTVNTIKQTEEMPVIRKPDLENHNKDGGLWIVVNGKVYDVQEFRWVWCVNF